MAELTSIIGMDPTKLGYNQWGSRVAFLGDSITQSANDNANQSRGQSYPLMAELHGQGRFQAIRNAGVAGDTSAQMLARFDTDVTPYNPNLVVLMAGTNDIGNSVAFSTYQSNVSAIVDKIRLIGAMPVICTIPPNDIATRHDEIEQWNLWLRLYASLNALMVCDMHSVLVDPDNGNYLSGYSSDGTHPEPVAQSVMGELIADFISGYLTPWTAPLVQAQDDEIQILGDNPLFIDDANADGVPDNWIAYGATTGITHTLETVAGVKGKMLKIDAVATGGNRIAEHTINAANWSVGDELLFAGIVDSDGGIELQLKINFASASASAFPMRLEEPVTLGRFLTRVVIPANTTAIQFQIIAISGTGYVQLGQLTCYNLTVLAFDDL